jgi:lysozyme
MSNDPAVPICAARLLGEEGRRQFAYNDATGKRVTCLPGGNLSIGIGVNLENGLDDAEIDWLLQHRLGLVADQLAGYSWYAGCDPVRASVLLDLGYNAGVGGLLHFVHMLAAVARKDWATAATELLDSGAARQLPTRYQPLAKTLRDGA